MRGTRKTYKRKYNRYRRKYRRYKRAYRARQNVRRALKKYVHVHRPDPVIIVTYSHSSGIAAYGSKQYSLSNVINRSEFTTLWQEYRINCVVTKFTPLFDSGTVDSINSVPATSGYPITNLPSIGWAIDYNDANVPTSLEEIQQFSNYKEALFNKEIKIKIWPACAPGIYISGIAAGYAVKRKAWLRCGNDDIPHYGLKYCVFNIANNVNYKWNLTTKYYMSFRGMY